MPLGTAKLEVFAYSVFTWPETPCEVVVDDHHQSPVLVFVACESTAVQKRDLHRLEIIGTDDGPIDVDHLTRIQRPVTFRLDIVLPAIRKTGQVRGNCRLLDARLRLLTSRRATEGTSGDGSLTVGDLVIEEATYTARLKGRALELTYKEFELLKYLAQHAGRVFTRAQLLQEVWGYDFFGGTRTVDVHVRRLRAKLGPEYDAMIGTVRNVGYKFVRPSKSAQSSRAAADAEAAEQAIADDVEALA